MNPNEIQSYLNIVFLLGGVIFNIAFWYFKLTDIEKRLTTAGKRIGRLETLTYRIINYGNRKLDWDFPFYEDEREE
ncbi:MAG: hypothetical protein ACRC2R_10860 [Xenococcaceae cyanobacterium]